MSVAPTIPNRGHVESDRLTLALLNLTSTGQRPHCSDPSLGEYGYPSTKQTGQKHASCAEVAPSSSNAEQPPMHNKNGSASGPAATTPAAHANQDQEQVTLMTWAKPTRSSAARGYGAKHRKLRAALLPQAYGTPCVRCGQLMLPGQLLHLDHNDYDRTKLLGFSHADCNREAGARKAKAVRRYGKTRVKTRVKPVHRW